MHKILCAGRLKGHASERGGCFYAPEGHSHCSITERAMEGLPCPLAHSARLRGSVIIVTHKMVDRRETGVRAPTRASARPCAHSHVPQGAVTRGDGGGTHCPAMYQKMAKKKKTTRYTTKMPMTMYRSLVLRAEMKKSAAASHPSAGSCKAAGQAKPLLALLSLKKGSLTHRCALPAGLYGEGMPLQ